eukprot:2830979-Prymnesium_polylepis.1
MGVAAPQGRRGDRGRRRHLERPPFYATDRLRDDEALVAAAVEQDGRALIYAMDRLRNNDTVVAAAVK